MVAKAIVVISTIAENVLALKVHGIQQKIGIMYVLCNNAKRF